MPGRKPIPSEIQRLKGAYRKDPQRERADEPEFADAPVECPDYLGEIGKAEWARIYPQLVSARLMKPAYMAALAAYCISFQRWVEAETQLKDNGLLVEGANGYPIVSPFLAIGTQAMRDMRAFLTEFGMTPSSKTRAASDGSKQEATNRFAKLAQVVPIKK